MVWSDTLVISPNHWSGIIHLASAEVLHFEDAVTWSAMSYNYNRYSLGSYPGSYTPGLYSSYGSSPSSVHSSGLGSGYSSRSGSTSSLSSIGSGHGHSYTGHHPTSSYTPYLRVCKLNFLIFVLTIHNTVKFFFINVFMERKRGVGGMVWTLSVVIYTIS